MPTAQLALPLLRAHSVLRMTFDPTEKSGVGAWYILAREQRVIDTERRRELRVDTERRNVIVSETWSRRGDGVFARERDREQGPRQEEDGADQALPGRPPAVSLLAKTPAA